MVIVTWATDLVSDSLKVALVVIWIQQMDWVKGGALIPGLDHPIKYLLGLSHPETELVVVLEIDKA